MPVDLSESLLRQLSPAQVRWYAVQAGWKPVDGVKRPVIVLNHPTDKLTQLQIPTAGSDRERAFLMEEAIRRLAEAENRPACEILNDLAAPAADILRVRVESRDEQAGSLPLDRRASPFRGRPRFAIGRRVQRTPTASLLSPADLRAAQAFLRGCRVGQTERGSFVVTILSPVIPDVAPSLFNNGDAAIDWVQEPYERRVTLLLMQALQTVRGRWIMRRRRRCFTVLAGGSAPTFARPWPRWVPPTLVRFSTFRLCARQAGGSAKASNHGVNGSKDRSSASRPSRRSCTRSSRAA